MASAIIRQIVDRLHVGEPEAAAVAAVKNAMKRGAWDRLDAKTRAKYTREAKAVHKANLKLYLRVMR